MLIDLPQHSVADELARDAKFSHRALHRADLKNPLVLKRTALTIARDSWTDLLNGCSQ